MKRTLFTLAIAAMLATPLVLAGDDDAPKAEKGTPFQRLLEELKTLVAVEKVKPDYDKELLDRIEAIVRSFEKQEKPVTLDDLTEEDRQRLEEELRKKIEEERRAAAAAAAGGEWQSGLVDRILSGAELSEEQAKRARGPVEEYVKDSSVAWQNRDFKLVNDLKKDLEKQLTREIGKDKAKDVMNSLNKSYGGFGRGGR